MRMKRALITGITGQDGSYLAELLLSKGYEVHGIIRRSSSFNTGRIDHIFNSIKLHYGDVTDGSAISAIIAKVRPHEIYNLAAQSHVMVSFEMPEYTMMADGLGMLKILEAVRSAGIADNCHIYQASTSEMYGFTPGPQDENSPFQPCSPYGTAKLYAHWLCDNYRKSYGMHISCGILFNHESPRRGETFVTRKVTKAVTRIAKGSDTPLVLGNLEAKRDWGHAKDYVEAMWLMVQQQKPDDYVIATGRTVTVRYLVETAFENVGIKIEWHKTRNGEFGADDRTGHILVQTDDRYRRPNEVDFLHGMPYKAQNKLGWVPKVTFEELIREMVMEDMK
jgi:GDPmannose 4,6-dehydratase